MGQTGSVLKIREIEKKIHKKENSDRSEGWIWKAESKHIRYLERSKRENR